MSVRTKQPMACLVDFTIAEATLKDTGPVTLTFFVNDRQLDKQTFRTEGARHFEKPVPRIGSKRERTRRLGLRSTRSGFPPRTARPWVLY